MGEDRAAAISGPVFPHTALDADPGGVRSSFLDPHLQRSFQRDGFAVVPFLAPELVDRIREICKEVGPAPGDEQDGYFPGNVSPSAEWKRTVIATVTPLVQDRLDELFDDHHVFHLTFMTKWPGPGGKLQTHQDPTMVDHEGRYRSFNVWCPLTFPAATDRREHGMVRVLRGSTHLATGTWYRARGGLIPSGIEEIEELVYDRLAEPVAIEPGQALVLDHRLVHCSPPNQCDEPRLVLAVGMRPRESPSVHVECDADGSVSMYEVDDEYFIRHPDVDPTSYPLLRRIDRRPGPTVTLTDLQELRSGDSPGPGPLPAAVGVQARPTPAWLDWVPLRLAARRRQATLLADPEADARLDRDGFVVLPLLDPAEAARLGSVLAETVTSEAERADLLARSLRTVLPHTLLAGWSNLAERVQPRSPAELPDPLTRPHRLPAFTDERAGWQGWVLWLALDDIDDVDGCPRVARGSHRLDGSVRGHDLEAGWLEHEEVWTSRLLTVPLARGQAVICHPGLVHAWGHDTAGRDRQVAQCLLMPSGSPVVHHRRAGAGVATRHEVDPVLLDRCGIDRLADLSLGAPGTTTVEVDPMELSPTALARRLDARPLAVLDRLRRRGPR
ncbi:MAG: hypothetical protein JWM47_411 [Acidimicrobiales bacterium]|nr:hypothetical protein [Acidimicrobiales bacterium]